MECKSAHHVKASDSHTCTQVVDITSFLKVAVDEQAPGYVADVEVSIMQIQLSERPQSCVCVRVHTKKHVETKLGNACTIIELSSLRYIHAMTLGAHAAANLHTKLASTWRA